MSDRFSRPLRPLSILALLGGLAAAALAPPSLADPIVVRLDATGASRSILHATLEMSVAPGELTLLYPKYIPGEHGPTGPVENLTGLSFTADGSSIRWRRDPVDMYTFHLTVPDGASHLTVNLDYLTPVQSGDFTSGVSTTADMAVINWNQVLLYPAGARASEVRCRPSLLLPEGWHAFTAMEPASGNGRARSGSVESVPRVGKAIRFEEVSLETLVDSPVLAGRYVRREPLSPGQTPAHFLDLVADNEAALAIEDDALDAFRNLIAQAGILFGSHHYRHYDFLLTLSDHTAHFGLEHHESSDDRTGAAMFTEPDAFLMAAGLLPHELVHSWNGKFRRPSGLATPDFEEPMKTTMLWVYEGLTTYLGDLLTARSGLWSIDEYREYLAFSAAHLDHRTGRTWRPLIDTATAAQILYGGPGDRTSWRRGVDFYREGELIWLDVDTRIRELSGGKKSLDDFVRAFYGIEDGVVAVRPYRFEDVVAALNDVAAADWASFLRKRLDRTGVGAPLDGLERSGWRLVYGDKRSHYQEVWEKRRHRVEEMFSIGITVNDQARITDVLKDSPADRAGVAAGMKVIAVNDLAYTAERLREAVKGTPEAGGLTLLTERSEVFASVRLEYKGGARYPELERIPDADDGLAAILAAREGPTR